ncbi:MAG: response regulator transcription factor [Bacteroidetes bacterium]|nr:response regulator transcription factor [Bacteroidota bacterium]MBU1117101.1 response regulator transcription factor [Bacteroidota bacterium]MBU1799767.1 response regulator transcription factor [Bacteroidota bacterium]
MTNIALIEDDIELKELLEKYLNFQENFNVALSVVSAEDFFEKCKQLEKIDILIMDIGLPGISGIEALPKIKQNLPNTEIIMLTVHDDSEKVFQSLRRGASGYLLKNTPLDKIKESIEQIFAGGSPMSPNIARKIVEFFNPKHNEGQRELSTREKEIVVALVDGLSYKLVADRLDISIDTVRQHIRSIYRKLNVNSKAEVISKSYKGEI